MTMISPVWKHKCTPLDPTMYQGLLVLHLLGKLLALSYLHHLDEKTHHHSWLAKEQVGFYLGTTWRTISCY